MSTEDLKSVRNNMINKIENLDYGMENESESLKELEKKKKQLKDVASKMYDLTSLSNNFEVVLDNKNNQLVLKDETSFNQVVKDLTNFIDDLKKAKEEYTQNKINETVLEKLKNGESDVDIVKQLYNESEDDLNNRTDVNTENEFNNVEQNN